MVFLSAGSQLVSGGVRCGEGGAGLSLLPYCCAFLPLGGRLTAPGIVPAFDTTPAL